METSANPTSPAAGPPPHTTASTEPPQSHPPFRRQVPGGAQQPTPGSSIQDSSNRTLECPQPPKRNLFARFPHLAATLDLL
ncbi:hypothetical protein FRC11_011110, partial [Ceratobasidium sp. 423]